MPALHGRLSCRRTRWSGRRQTRSRGPHRENAKAGDGAGLLVGSCGRRLRTAVPGSVPAASRPSVWQNLSVIGGESPLRAHTLDCAAVRPSTSHGQRRGAIGRGNVVAPDECPTAARTIRAGSAVGRGRAIADAHTPRHAEFTGLAGRGAAPLADVDRRAVGGHVGPNPGIDRYIRGAGVSLVDRCISWRQWHTWAVIDGLPAAVHAHQAYPLNAYVLVDCRIAGATHGARLVGRSKVRGWAITESSGLGVRCAGIGRVLVGRSIS